MRLDRALRKLEGPSISDRPPTAAPTPVTAHPAIIRVTSATPTSDRYPGKLQTYDLTAKTYSDGADCWVVGPNGESLTTGKYHTRLMGILAADSKAVFIASGRVQGSGTLNTIPKWTPDGFTLGDSNETDDGTTFGIGKRFSAAAGVVTTGSTDALDVGDLSTVFLNCSDAITVIGGIANGTAGRRLKFINVSSNVALFEHEEGTASAGDRLRLSESTDQLYTANEGIDLVYGSDGTASRWRACAGTVQHDHGDGTQYIARATVTIANTTTETTIISGTGSGSTTLDYALGYVIRWHAAGYVSSTGANPTLTTRTKLAGTTHITRANLFVINPTNSNWSFDGHFLIHTDGSPGTLRGSQGSLGEFGAGVDVMQADGNVTSPAAGAFNMTMQWDAAAAGNTVTISEFFVEVLPTPQ